MKIRSLLRRFYVMNALEDGGGGGGTIETPAAPVAAPAPAPAAAPVAAPSAAPVSAPAAAPVAGPSAAPAPKQTMLEAITKGLERGQPPAAAPVAAPGQPRDHVGRFVPKVGADGKVLPGQPPAGSPVADPAAPKPGDTPADDDVTAMPEGLGQKAQERFQRLANSNKELVGKVDTLDRQVGYIRETFGKHGVNQQQFEQAATLIGAINRGDYKAAQQVLMTQLQNIAVLTGEPVAGIDALANYPDLRQAVDGMQITEVHALELARGRMQNQQHQQQQQRQQATQQSEQQERAAVDGGTKAVDAFCKKMLATDLDYPAIEAHLLPEISNLLRGVPPAQWAATVEAQYRVIKKVAGSSRTAAPAPPSNPLRPTGHGSLQQAPKSMYEAIFGESAPR